MNTRSKYWSEMVDILDKHFEKGKCRERGQAMCMLAEIEMLLRDIKISSEPPKPKHLPVNHITG